jgi:dGTPase
MTIPEPSCFEERFTADDPGRPDEVRTEYERDRARVIHSAAFRRLQGKTQVMGVGEGDFHRTRLTHSVECAQIGAGLLDQLVRSRRVPSAFEKWLPTKELMEAACFAHDLGHPPFGHGGEAALFGEMRDKGGFEGNAHTFRILTRLEKHSRPGLGINPTRRMALAVLKYPRAYSAFDLTKPVFAQKPPKCYFDEDAKVAAWATEAFSESDRETFAGCDSKHKPMYRTFDCSVMELADDIAYGVHDIEDIVARRLATKDQVSDALMKSFSVIGGELNTSADPLDGTKVCSALFADSFRRKQMIGRLVNTFMTAVAIREQDTFSHPLLRFRAFLPSEHGVLLEQVRNMSHSLVIEKPGVQQLERRGKLVVSKLYGALMEDPAHLIDHFGEWDGLSAMTQEREVCDYVAGMTDSYAERIYSRFFVPGFGSSHDEL